MNTFKFPSSPSRLFQWSIISLVGLTQLIWVIQINYPPTTEQLTLGTSHPTQLWLLRLISFTLIITATFLISQIAKPKFRWIFWLLVLISPSIPAVWMSYPLPALKILCLSIIIFLFHTRRIGLLTSTLIAIAILLTVNSLFVHQSPTIFSALTLKTSQAEAMARFSTEDTINPHTNIPLPVRRIGYNKYFISLKNSLSQSLSFFDTESLFFQEIHPLEAKSLVIFYWPEVFIFLISLWLLITKPISTNKQAFSLLFLFSFFYFIFTDDTPYKRLLLTIWLISLLMTSGMEFVANSKNKFLKWCVYLSLLFTSYGFITHLHDRQIRPLFWLDNRPVVYQKLLTAASQYNYQNYQQVYLSDTIGSGSLYCRYYLPDCSRFVFANFDLSDRLPEPGALYLGLPGNFYGPSLTNTFPENYAKSLREQGLLLLTQDQIRDNVANRYGQGLIVASSKE